MITAAQSLAAVVDALCKNPAYEASFKKSLEFLIAALGERRVVFIAGNGGSAAEAQHFAAEIVGRYKRERSGYPAIALTVDTSALTAIGNDYGFDHVFSRQVESLGKSGDVLVILSTSGNSNNIMRALDVAKARGMKTIALLGKDGGASAGQADVEIIVPSNDTARIQEVHLLIIHAWCEHIEPHLS